MMKLILCFLFLILSETYGKSKLKQNSDHPEDKYLEEIIKQKLLSEKLNEKK
jgi:hypothetical protein